MARHTTGSGRNNPAPQPVPPTVTHEKSVWKNPIFWINLLTLFAVFTYTGFSWRQVSETQTANLIAKKALSEANKPYLMFTGFTPNRIKDNNGIHLRMGINWTNFGNTPANYVRYHDCAPIIRDDSAPPVIKCNPTDPDAGESVVGPKQGATIIGPKIEDADLAATIDEKKAIYILGYVTYQDNIDVDQHGFPEQRETRFCQRIIQQKLEMLAQPGAVTLNPPPALVQPPPGIGPIAALACPVFNCMDNACPPR
jgi:hypothetical protein